MKDKFMDFFNKNKIAVIAGGVALVAVIVGVIIALVSCGGNGGSDKKNDGPVEYTLNVQTEGGMAFEDVNVYVYQDKDIDNLLFAGKTDENGQFKFTTDLDPDTFGYKLDGMPEEGYELKDMYELSSSKKEDNQLYLCVSMKIEPLEDMANTKFELGAVIKDFTVTTPDGTEVTISKLLEEKDAVVLNFFYLACQPCKNEFPYLEEAYKQYSENLAVVAMTPVDKDNANIKAFAEELGLTFYVAQCASEWEQMMSLKAYPTTVVIDKWGMISFIHEGSVTESGVFEAIFAYYDLAKYTQGVVKYLDDILTVEAEEGTKDNPIEILPDASEFDAKVAAGKEVYFEIPKVTNMILEIKDADAYVIYEEKKYEAVDGVVSLTISAPDTYTPAQFVVGNKGGSEKTFKATLTAVQGTMMNPYTMNTGSFTANIEAGNEQGLYYKYIAAESGTLTLKPTTAGAGTSYDITLYNLNTYVNNTISANGNADGSVSVVVNAGDEVQIVIGTFPNAENEYPAADIAVEASFVPGEGTGTSNNNANVEYTVTVKDADGKAMSGVKVTIDTVEATTDASGVAKVTLKSGSYTVAITAPNGYKVQGEVTVTADAPNATASLVSTTAKQVTYTVKVTDESGNAIKGATVIVGNSLATTNTSGSASVTLAEGTYDVTVSANGYVTGSGKVTKTSTSVTVKLKKNTASQTGTTYTINVVDYKGAAQKNLTVVFKSNGTPVATATTDSSGKATASLTKGTYDIAIAFAGGNSGFDSTNAQVTASKTSTTIMVGPKAAAYDEEVYFDATGAYELSLGGNYVEVPSDDQTKKDVLGNYVNSGGNAFFIFETDTSGTYKFTVSNTTAKISYWGISTVYVFDSTSLCTTTSTSVSVNLKPSNIPDGGKATVIIGIKGVSSCVIAVERTGNAVLDEGDVAYTTYTAKKAPTKQSLGLSLSSMAYVDITSSTTFKVVYDSNGYGHLGSVDGPMLYINLDANDRFGLSFLTMYGEDGTDSGTTSLRKTFYNADGTLNKKEDYTDCIRKYILNRDAVTGLYPLTEDLEYMLKNGGDGADWWNLSSNVSGLSEANAWMFACCYVK